MLWSYAAAAAAASDEEGEHVQLSLTQVCMCSASPGWPAILSCLLFTRNRAVCQGHQHGSRLHHRAPTRHRCSSALYCPNNSEQGAATRPLHKPITLPTHIPHCTAVKRHLSPCRLCPKRCWLAPATWTNWQCNARCKRWAKGKAAAALLHAQLRDTHFSISASITAFVDNLQNVCAVD